MCSLSRLLNQEGCVYCQRVEEKLQNLVSAVCQSEAHFAVWSHQSQCCTGFADSLSRHESVSGSPPLIYPSHLSPYVSIYSAFHFCPHVDFLPLDSLTCPDFFTFPPLSGKMGTNGMVTDPQWWGIFLLCCCCLFSAIVYSFGLSLSLNVSDQLRAGTASARGRGTAKYAMLSFIFYFFNNVQFKNILFTLWFENTFHVFTWLVFSLFHCSYMCKCSHFWPD